MTSWNLASIAAPPEPFEVRKKTNTIKPWKRAV